MKKRITIPIGVFALIALLALVYLGQTSKLSHALEEDALGTLTLNELEDGSYSGAYESTLVSAYVEVEVSNHKIVEIKLIRHDTMFGKDAESIIEEIMITQSLEVDDVAGATYSSAVIKRAVEDALTDY